MPKSFQSRRRRSRRLSLLKRGSLSLSGREGIKGTAITRDYQQKEEVVAGISHRLTGRKKKRAYPDIRKKKKKEKTFPFSDVVKRRSPRGRSESLLPQGKKREEVVPPKELPSLGGVYVRKKKEGGALAGKASTCAGGKTLLSAEKRKG